MLKAVIFDMDGVLVDSEPLHYKANYLTMKENFGIELDYEYYKQFIGSTVAYLWNKIKEDFHITQYSADELNKINDKTLEYLVRTEGYPPVKGAADFVKELKNQGYKIAVASSSKRFKIMDNLSMLGILDCFDAIISGAELLRPKPFPDIFLKAAKELGVSERECLVIEDSENGVRAAAAAGIACAGFLNPSSGNQDLSVADYLFEDFLSIDEAFLRMIHDHHFNESWIALETEHLFLREMIPEDIDEIYRLYKSLKIIKYIEKPFEDRAEELAYMKSYYNTIYKFYGYGIWLITFKDGKIIGRAGIENNPDGEIELGYMLAPQYQQKGYALEACEAVLKFAEEKLELNRRDIVCHIHKENMASVKLAEKLGITIKFIA